MVDKMSSVLKCVGMTDTGLVRENNEDSFYLSGGSIGTLDNVFIVADGMGGHQAGEVASAKAIEFFIEYLNKNVLSGGDPGSYLADGVSYANGKVFKLSLTAKKYAGMGTTFAACTVRDGKVFFAHIGDSRIYAVNSDGIGQVTEDHTFANEAVRSGEMTAEQVSGHPGKNMLTRALGTEPDCSPDSGCLELDGNTVLLCSDGLTNMVSDEAIKRIVNKKINIRTKALYLIDAANKNGGADNTTVVLLCNRGEDK